MLYTYTDKVNGEILPLYYDMDNCKHKPITADNGEIVCSNCGIVLGQDYYYSDEDNNIFYDKRSKTDPWLLGLGTMIGTDNKDRRKVIKSRYLDDQYYKEDSNFANFIEYLNLQNNALDIKYRFRQYNKRKGDKPYALRLSVLASAYASNRRLTLEQVNNALDTTYGYKPKKVSVCSIPITGRLARHLGARYACILFNRVIKDARK